MAIRFAPLTRENDSAALHLLMQWWRQDWSEDFALSFFEWRYWARPHGDAVIAFDGGNCVAIVDSFIRPYLFGRRSIMVRETCDWFCLPKYRPYGIGVKLMRQLMAKPEPMISVGGSDATISLLPRLQWQRLPDVGNYVLPVSARMATGSVLQRLGLGSGRAARALPSFWRLRSPRVAAAPAKTAQVGVWTRDQGVPSPPSDSYALAALLGDADAQWLASAPAELGELVGLRFTIDGVAVGLSLSRIERFGMGRRAKLLHVQATEPTPQGLAWMIGETARHLVARGAEMILCRASCPRIARALCRAGFLSWRPSPTYWWSNSKEVPGEPLHLTFNRADDGLPFDASGLQKAAPSNPDPSKSMAYSNASAPGRSQ